MTFMPMHNRCRLPWTNYTLTQTRPVFFPRMPRYNMGMPVSHCCGGGYGNFMTKMFGFKMLIDSVAQWVAPLRQDYSYDSMYPDLSLSSVQQSQYSDYLQQQQDFENLTGLRNSYGNDFNFSKFGDKYYAVSKDMKTQLSSETAEGLMEELKTYYDNIPVTVVSAAPEGNEEEVEKVEKVEEVVTAPAGLDEKPASTETVNGIARDGKYVSRVVFSLDPGDGSDYATFTPPDGTDKIEVSILTDNKKSDAARRRDLMEKLEEEVKKAGWTNVTLWNKVDKSQPSVIADFDKTKNYTVRMVYDATYKEGDTEVGLATVTLPDGSFIKGKGYPANVALAALSQEITKAGWTKVNIDASKVVGLKKTVAHTEVVKQDKGNNAKVPSSSKSKSPAISASTALGMPGRPHM